MAKYNVIGSYYVSPTENVNFYPVTRYDNLDTMGVYARRIPGGVDISGTIPFINKLNWDTNPTWATQQSDGSILINRAGFYNCHIFFYAPGEAKGYEFAVSLRARRGSNNELLLAENYANALDSGQVVMVTVGGMYYLNVGDIVRGATSINPGGGIHPSSQTYICLKPYQFDTKFWG
jgi:hypothetical protein